jgi:hypothetical protein
MKTNRRLLLAIGAMLAAILAASDQRLAHAQTPTWVGSWGGTLSSQAFQLDLWQTAGVPNAQITFAGYIAENLSFLGTKKGILYFWRLVDQASVSVYPTNQGYEFAYFEANAVRTGPLTRLLHAADSAPVASVLRSTGRP